MKCNQRGVSAKNELPAEDACDNWLDRLSYRRLLSVSESLLVAVKAPDSEVRKAFNAARMVARKERAGEHGKMARRVLLDVVKRYLERHLLLDPTHVQVERPVGAGIPALTVDGTLPPGFWHATPTEFLAAFAGNHHRLALLKRALPALLLLKTAGCKKVTIAGSFCSNKPKPSDIDLVWDVDGLKLELLPSEFVEGTGLERQNLFGIDSFPSSDEWKLKLCLVQSLWGAGSPCKHEITDQEWKSLPHFRAVGVIVIDLTQDLPTLEF